MRILTTGINGIDPEKFIPITEKGSGCGLNKPDYGSCLYGSTMIKNPNGSVYSDWKRFTSTDYCGKDRSYGISYKLKKSAKIFEVGSLDDYKKLIAGYPLDEGFQIAIDFFKLSQDYDVFHLTTDAFWDLRVHTMYFDEYFDEHTMKIANWFKKEQRDIGKRIADFYAYDAETWLIFNIDCINFGSILSHGNVQYEEFVMEALK